MSMAAKAGESFPDLLLSAYIVPTRELHTTLASAYSRVTTSPNRLAFDYRASKQQIDFCILQALALIYMVRKVAMRDTFCLPLEAEMDRFEKAFVKASATER